MDKRLQYARYLAQLLDNQFQFLGVRFGLDPILGLFPGIGDAIALAVAVYILYLGYSLRVPREAFIRMVLNVILDYFVGVVPVIGDLLDVVVKSNIANVAILEKYVDPKIIEGEFVD